MLATAIPSQAAPVSSPAATPATHRVFYRLTDSSHLLVRVKLNGRGPFNFIIDTGAPALVLGPDVARRAGVGSVKNGWGTFNTLEVEGGARLNRVAARIEEIPQLRAMNAMGLPGVHLDGVLGYNVLAPFRIEIDLTEPTLKWTKLSVAPRPPALPRRAGGKPLAPSPGMAAMEGLSRIVGVFMRPAPNETVLRGFLGMELEDAPGTRRSRKRGARVRSVLAGTPAAAAGLTAGDTIAAVRVGGGQLQTVRSAADAQRALARLRPGAMASLTVRHGAGTQALRLRVLRLRAAQGSL